jgi:endonuclease/exonuclease/phosphatase family metal-dependent hydrolase
VKKRWLFIIGIILLLGAAAYQASMPVSAGPDAGESIEGQDRVRSVPRETFRIATFNIHRAIGPDGRSDIDRVAGLLGGLDFIALNEAKGPPFWQSKDQPRELGEKLGMGWLFAPACKLWFHVGFGNGLLSSMPVDYWQRIPLPRHFNTIDRNAVLVNLKHRRQTIHVLLTHLNQNYDEERQCQLRAVINLFLSLSEPAILLGDLNSYGDDPQIGQLLSTAGVRDPVGEILVKDARQRSLPGRVDWIIVRGLEAVDAGMVENEASDHPMIWAELKLKDGQTSQPADEHGP